MLCPVGPCGSRQWILCPDGGRPAVFPRAQCVTWSHSASRPRGPKPGYGYLRLPRMQGRHANPRKPLAPLAYRKARDGPSAAADASEYDSGMSGIFYVPSAGDAVDAYHEPHAPQLNKSLVTGSAATGEFEIWFTFSRQKTWGQADDISVDYAIMGKNADNLA